MDVLAPTTRRHRCRRRQGLVRIHGCVTVVAVAPTSTATYSRTAHDLALLVQLWVQRDSNLEHEPGQVVEPTTQARRKATSNQALRVGECVQ